MAEKEATVTVNVKFTFLMVTTNRMPGSGMGLKVQLGKPATELPAVPGYAATGDSDTTGVAYDTTNVGVFTPHAAVSWTAGSSVYTVPAVA